MLVVGVIPRERSGAGLIPGTEGVGPSELPDRAVLEDGFDGRIFCFQESSEDFKPAPAASICAFGTGKGRGGLEGTVGDWADIAVFSDKREEVEGGTGGSNRMMPSWRLRCSAASLC